MDDKVEEPEAASMLTALGFRYHEDAACWMHPHSGRVISRETVAAHDTEWLVRWITSE